MISINLGLVNLLPIPVLDGGHLVFFLFEAIFAARSRFAGAESRASPAWWS